MNQYTILIIVLPCFISKLRFSFFFFFIQMLYYYTGLTTCFVPLTAAI